MEHFKNLFLCHEIGFSFQFQYLKWEFYNIIVDGISSIAITAD